MPEALDILVYLIVADPEKSVDFTHSVDLEASNRLLVCCFDALSDLRGLASGRRGEVIHCSHSIHSDSSLSDAFRINSKSRVHGCWRELTLIRKPAGAVGSPTFKFRLIYIGRIGSL